MKPAPITPHPVLERLIAFPGDVLRSKDVADIFGGDIHRASVTAALRNGHIASLEGKFQSAGFHGNHARRRVMKSAVIAWLWETHKGDRLMMRATLAQHAPQVLAILEAKDAEASGKIEWHPNASARRVRAMPLPPAAPIAIQTELFALPPHKSA